MTTKSTTLKLLTNPLNILMLSLWTMGAVAFSQPFLDPKTAFKLQSEEKATLIDVREADEIEAGMAKGALWFPLSKAQKDGEDQEKFLKSLSKEKLMAVYCRSGKRAEVFVSILRAIGYKAENMGGFADWEKANLPVSKNTDTRKVP